MNNALREDLSSVTFEDLLKIRNKVGTKVYRHVVLNQLKEKSENELSQNPSQDNKSRKFEFKRQNRSQPIEVSSKKLDSRFIFQRLQPSDDLIQKKKMQTFRDPRFDPGCGKFRLDKFKQNYAFLTDVKRKELETLRKKLKKAKNHDTKEKIQFLIQRLMNQINAEEEQEKSKHVKKKLEQKVVQVKGFDVQLKESQSDKKKNKKPKVFVNKGILKRTQLVEKYKHLKQSGKLDKYLEKKRKKLATKDRKRLKNTIGNVKEY